MQMLEKNKNDYKIKQHNISLQNVNFVLLIITSTLVISAIRLHLNNPEIIGIVSSRDIVRLYLHALEKHENMLTNQLIDNYYWQEESMEEINS